MRPAALVADGRPAAPAHHFLLGRRCAIKSGGSFTVTIRVPAGRACSRTIDRPGFADALFAASRHWQLALHFNKGLAGAPPEEIAAARQTALNPEALEAFALAICAGGGPPAYAGMPATRLGAARGRCGDHRSSHGASCCRSHPAPGRTVSRADYFEAQWQKSFWGSNYGKLAAVKRKYDPEGLFWVHHGVGSEAWSDDGFTPRTA